METACCFPLSLIFAVLASLHSTSALFCSDSTTNNPLPCDQRWQAKYAYAIARLRSFNPVDSCSNSNNHAYHAACQLGSIASTATNDTTRQSSIPFVHLLPAISARGTIYANVFCALCNNESTWHILPFSPTCKAVATESLQEEAVTTEDLDLLYGYLLGHCEIQELYLSRRRHARSLSLDKLKGMEASLSRHKRDDVSESAETLRRTVLQYFNSFSVILNFGFDGQSSLEIEPVLDRHRCESDEIYDSITQTCRNVYCPIGTRGDSCQELDIEEQNEPTETIIIDTSLLCVLELEMTLTKRLYDWLIPYLRNIEKLFAMIFGIEESKMIVKLFITQTNMSSGCSSSSTNATSSGERKISRCWLYLKALFVAYIPTFPYTNEFCSVVVAAGAGDLSEISLRDQTITIANQTFQLPYGENLTQEVVNSTVTNANVTVNASVAQDVADNFTRLHDMGVHEASVVRLDKAFCSKLHAGHDSSDDDIRSVYSYQSPEFYVLKQGNFEYETKNISYSETVDGVTETHLQYEQLFFLSETRRVYKEGEYQVVSRLSWSRESRWHREAVGYAVVCEYRLTNCTRIGYNADLVTWGANKTVLLNGVVYSQSTYVWLSFQEIAVCMDPSSYSALLTASDGACDQNSYSYLFYWSTLTLVSYQLNLLSVFCSIAIMFTYAVIRELHNLPGYNMINLSVASIMSRVTFNYVSSSIVAHNRAACVTVAALQHYFILTELMWMTVIAFHAFDVFVLRGTRIEKFDTFKRLLVYSSVGWGLPGLWVGLCVAIDRIVWLSQLLDLRFYYGEALPDSSAAHEAPDLCWINDSEQAFYIFGIPLCIIVLVNCLLFLVTCFTIRKFARHNQVSRLSLSRTSDCGRAQNWTTRDVQIFAKLSLVTGVVWITAVAFVAIEGLSSTSPQQHNLALCSVLCVAEVCFVVAQGSLGILQFYAFVWSPRILAYYAMLANRVFQWTADRCCRKSNTTRLSDTRDSNRTPCASVSSDVTNEIRCSDLPANVNCAFEIDQELNKLEPAKRLDLQRDTSDLDSLSLRDSVTEIGPESQDVHYCSPSSDSVFIDH